MPRTVSIAACQFVGQGPSAASTNSPITHADCWTGPRVPTSCSSRSSSPSSCSRPSRTGMDLPASELTRIHRVWEHLLHRKTIAGCSKARPGSGGSTSSPAPTWKRGTAGISTSPISTVPTDWFTPTTRPTSSRLKREWHDRGRRYHRDGRASPSPKVGFNVCYEAEIPECAASLAEQGAEIILCPSLTFTEARLSGASATAPRRARSRTRCTSSTAGAAPCSRPGGARCRRPWGRRLDPEPVAIPRGTRPRRRRGIARAQHRDRGAGRGRPRQAPPKSGERRGAHPSGTAAAARTSTGRGPAISTLERGHDRPACASIRRRRLVVIQEAEHGYLDP